MAEYKVPRRDFLFVLGELLRAEEVLPPLADGEPVSIDLVSAVIDEVAKLTEDVLSPLNSVGDQKGCKLVDGSVRTPPGFREAYNLFVEGGWIGLTAPEEVGGQGLPTFLNVAMHEMIMGSNLSFADYIGLPQAALSTILKFAEPDISEIYAPRLASGEWCATMCLTEPQCGTDIGLVRTTASSNGDGSYNIDGNKIFISGGDHDLTGNIVHLVLARLPDAPAGVRGLSLFLCPKYLVDGSGDPCERNSVSPVRLENKMGYKAASTCEMLFSNAKGWLLGEPNAGLRAMFTMVNTARLLVALQGLGTADRSYQLARDYALERVQGRALTGPAFPDQKADPLIVHPDVRRMLLSIRSFTDAGRAIALWLAIQIDVADRAALPEDREKAADLVALLTPVVKASFSDLGFESCNNSMQIWGGHGYIRDNGLEQLVRDCRIAQIQEGANGIQALDLIGRKLAMKEGRLWRTYCAMVESTLTGIEGESDLAEFADPLRVALGELRGFTDGLMKKAAEDPVVIGTAGVDYQRAFALVLFGWMWAEIVRVSIRKTDDSFHRSKVEVARYFYQRELPKVTQCLKVAGAPVSSLMAMKAEDF